MSQGCQFGTQVGTKTGSWQPFNLGPYERAAWSADIEATEPLNQGLNWYYSFDPDMAGRAFAEAAQRDSSSPMPWWGLALHVGPSINETEMEESASEQAWEALLEAQARAANASPVERALIDALSSRYDWPAPEDRSALDAAYAEAMADVYRAFPDDPDVATLYAESLMILRPWKQWSHTGEPEEGTLDALAALERARHVAPFHIGAHHLTIHATEGSRTPELGLVSADVLCTLAPDATHILHMPSHIYARMGRWEDSAKANIVANECEARLAKEWPYRGPCGWDVHHYDFLEFGYMMEGRRAEALASARAESAGQPLDVAREDVEEYDPFMLTVAGVYKRFGMWDEILAVKPLPKEFVVSAANLHHLRAIAFAAKGDVQSARASRELLVNAIAAVPAEAEWSTNKAIDILQVAVPYVDGEIAYREGNLERAIEKLTEAVELEDRLAYDEPPAWTTPTRHALGAVLLQADRAAEAEAVYRADLVRYPKNVWSLSGLATALEAQNKDTEALVARREADLAFAKSDIPMASSCFCVDGVAPPRDTH